jgi:hypothetical protein
MSVSQPKPYTLDCRMSWILCTVFLLVLNAGWLVPCYLSINSLIQWCQLEVSPMVYNTTPSKNVFPFLAFSHDMLVVTCLWAGIAIAWNTIGARIVRR